MLLPARGKANSPALMPSRMSMAHSCPCCQGQLYCAAQSRCKALISRVLQPWKGWDSSPTYHMWGGVKQACYPSLAWDAAGQTSGRTSSSTLAHVLRAGSLLRTPCQQGQVCSRDSRARFPACCMQVAWGEEGEGISLLLTLLGRQVARPDLPSSHP